jgi:hypothetical protein
VQRRDAACPIVTRAAAVEHGGMRLDRQVVLTQAGRATGCDFYADQNWAASEHLPGPNQPAISVRVTRYAHATTAFNAMARIGQAGGSAHEVDLTGSRRGVAFRTRFDPADGAKDWAYVVAIGTSVLEVRTAQTASELNAVEVARAAHL